VDAKLLEDGTQVVANRALASEKCFCDAGHSFAAQFEALDRASQFLICNSGISSHDDPRDIR
jgi:hypothetical protein